MKQVILLYFLVFSNVCFGQTYSKLIYHVDEQYNYFYDFEIDRDEIYFVVNNCAPGLTDYYCNRMIKTNMVGEVENIYHFDSLFTRSSDFIEINNGEILVTGRWLLRPNNNPSALLTFNEELNLEEKHIINPVDGEVTRGQGIVTFNDNYFLYGNTLNLSEARFYSSITRLDKDFDIVFNNKYSKGLYKNGCIDLQSTRSGDLIYNHFYTDDIGASEDHGLQIMTMDTNGKSLDSLELDRERMVQSLLASNEGDIYFATENLPYQHWRLSNGRINKYDDGLDTLKWSLELPFDNFINGRSYKTKSLIQVANGDILACGEVWEEGPDGPLENGQDHSWNGFVARITRGGEFVWLREYRIPNNHALLPHEDYGKYMHSVLNDMHELEDGRIVIGGTAYYNEKKIIDAGETESFLWLMTINADGCLEGEECEEVIVLDSIVNYDDIPIFTIGTEWTFDFTPKQISPYEIIHSYITYEITDTLRKEGKLVYKIENNRGFPEEIMYQDNEEIYFWDHALEDFQLTYDFNAQHSYNTKWTGVCHETDTIIADIIVDTTTCCFWAEGWGMRFNQQISIVNSGTIENTMHYEILEFVGKTTGGLRLNLGYGLCDFNEGTIGDIRCFEKGGTDIFINFKGNTIYQPPCDTIWTEIIDNVAELQNDLITIYPNPSGKSIYINSEDKIKIYRIELINEIGQKTRVLDIEDSNYIDISNLKNGMYWIMFYDESKLVAIKKFVKIE